LVSQAGYPIKRSDDNDENIWLDALIQRLQPDALVLDVRSELARGKVEHWRSNGVLTVTIDDPSERRLAADLAFYPPVPQVRQMDWTGFTGQLYVGWEWVVLRREFANRPPRLPHERPMVLVTMGGSDPAGLTLKAVEALDLLEENFETVVVLGPGFCHRKALRDLLSRTHCHFDVRQDVANMPGLMAQADLAVASFGITAYELAAMGVPAIYLCLTQDHAESASAFVEAGIAQSLGVWDQVTVPALAQQLQQTIAYLSGWKDVMDQNLVDGLGANRIATQILDCLNEGY
jgi:spore coat polysaccharide biosynthesis protein SpsF